MPMAAVSRPNVSGPPWSTPVAKIGRSTVSGMAAKFTTAQKQQDRADRGEAKGIADPFPQVEEDVLGRFRRCLPCHPHHQQGHQHGPITYRIEEEAEPLTHRRDQKTGNRRTYESRSH